MQVLFIFMDGIGLGENNPETNPFVRAKMPNLNALLDGRSLLKKSAPFVGEHATLLAIDPAVGVDGLPQSATGQAMSVDGKKRFGRDRLSLRTKTKSRSCRAFERRHVVFALRESREENNLAQCISAALL